MHIFKHNNKYFKNIFQDNTIVKIRIINRSQFLVLTVKLIEM
jgi:hypothetical protein